MRVSGIAPLPWTPDRRSSDATVKAHGGEVVKGTGDGALAAFLGAADAVLIQPSIERWIRRALEHLGHRIGLSLGDTCVENGDMYGTGRSEDGARPFDAAVELATRMHAPRLLARARARREGMQRIEV